MKGAKQLSHLIYDLYLQERWVVLPLASIFVVLLLLLSGGGPRTHNSRHLAEHFHHMTGDTTMSVEERDAEIPVILEKKRKPEKLPVVVSVSKTNEADEALYRWFPPVTQNIGTTAAAAAAAAAIGPTSTSLDATTTFEALHPGLAKRWASPDTTTSSCLNGKTNSETNKNFLTSSSNINGRTPPYGNNKLGDNGPISSHAEPAMPGSTLNGEGCAAGASGARAPLNAPPQATATSQLLFLVRHGQTDMNAAGKLQGRGVNAHLNAAGLSQAEGLGRFVRNVPFDTVTASSLHRAHETAMRIAELNVKCVERAQENGMPTMPAGGAASSSPKGASSPADSFCCGDKAQVRVRNFLGLDELSWGELEGQDSALEPWKSRLASLKAAWDDGDFDRAAKDGESLVEVRARASEALEACLDRGYDNNLVVSHGRTLRILLLSLSGLGLDQMTNIGKIPNAGLYIIEARRSGPGAARTYRLLKPCD